LLDRYHRAPAENAIGRRAPWRITTAGGTNDAMSCASSINRGGGTLLSEQPALRRVSMREPTMLERWRWTRAHLLLAATLTSVLAGVLVVAPRGRTAPARAQSSATPSPTDLLTELAERLLSTALPFTTPSGVYPGGPLSPVQLLPGALPADLSLALPMPPNSVLIGSAERPRSHSRLRSVSHPTSLPVRRRSRHRRSAVSMSMLSSMFPAHQRTSRASIRLQWLDSAGLRRLRTVSVPAEEGSSPRSGQAIAPSARAEAVLG
jgi:hypothetical protein